MFSVLRAMQILEGRELVSVLAWRADHETIEEGIDHLVRLEMGSELVIRSADEPDYVLVRVGVCANQHGWDRQELIDRATQRLNQRRS